ncbi:glycosyltransferase family 29 protein [Streptomyces himalayensis]|uniref:Glycosyltransferase family 29 protein n=1 Tax=Streptomyces himalayensis subsp. himalayensis TaxID=2756131 RepID=A0A7W0DR43_9ACTN|nr:glycosyltransferase family 29 protein [Streptomyces himalayensis]MBA2948969.1 glycosyltransferase family 29 protein [Streptomyces himalayensis subsp. himalayensis]
MTRVRSRWSRPRTGDLASAPTDAGPPTAQVTPAELEDCLRACAVHSGKLVGSLDSRRTGLAEKLRELLAVWASQSGAAPAAPAAGGLLRRGAKAVSGGGGITNDLLDALLAVGNKAVDCGYDDELNLALLISDTVLTQRKNSRAGWRLRGRLLEAMGRPADAAAAFERYLDLTKDDGFGVRARVTGIRTALERRAELLALLERTVPDATRFTAGPATDVWADGLAAHAAGDWDGAQARLVGALIAMDRTEAAEQDFQEALSHYLDLCTGIATRPTPELTEAIGLYAESRRIRMRGPVTDPLFGGVQWLSLGEFRNRIAGKSICLIANSAKVGESSMGAEIDSYDLVMRFNSYKIDPVHTGKKTDIHVSIHKHAFNWDKPVDIRLITGGNSADWKYSMRNKLVPGAQNYVGDESLRWPVRNIGGWTTEQFSAIPTSGFNMLWLLDFLDVSPTLDLIGFDFYESGAYRVAEAMKLPITNVHEYSSEKAWVMERAQSVSGVRISLR